jgi:hypothetical protein
MADPKYISFGPVMNPDGTPTEFTKQMFGVKSTSNLGRQDPDFRELKTELAAAGLVFQSSVPDRDNLFILIAYHPVSGNFSTHATSWNNEYLIHGHYDFPTFESARVDALERALHR